MNVLLQYRFSQGQPLTYSVTVDSSKKLLNSPQINMIGTEEQEHFELKITQELQDVMAEGNYKLRVTSEPIQRSMDGEAQPIASSQVVDVVMSPFGEILWASISSTISQPSYPSRQLDVGESWELPGEINSPFSPEPLSILLTYRLEGLETFQGISCAKITFDSEQQVDSLPNQVTQKTKMEGVHWFAPERGCLVQSEVILHVEVESVDEKIAASMKTSAALHHDKDTV